ncbi:MAG: methyl-accepting chemotaxis protein [Planctomycetota bacterium]
MKLLVAALVILAAVAAVVVGVQGYVLRMGGVRGLDQSTLAREVLYGGLAAGFAGLVLGGVAFWLVFRMLVTIPLRRVQSGFRRLAAGDLDFATAYGGKDEFGEFNRMISEYAGKLRGEVAAITQCLELLESFVKNNTRTAQNLAGDTTVIEEGIQRIFDLSATFREQLIGLQGGAGDLGRALDASRGGADLLDGGMGIAANAAAGMVTMAAGVADLAGAMAAVAGQAGEKIGDISTSVNEAASGIEEMSLSLKEVSRSCLDASGRSNTANQKARSTNDMVKKLNDSANKVGKIVGIINDIAEQTDLLALNATIEAAEAGDMGREFAVVANEVKALASRTSEATEQIGILIRDMQDNTAGAVAMIKEISDAIQEISGIYGTITLNIEEQNATINEIARVVSLAAGSLGDIARIVQTVRVNTGEVLSHSAATLARGREADAAGRKAAEMSRQSVALTAAALDQSRQVAAGTAAIQAGWQELVERAGTVRDRTTVFRTHIEGYIGELSRAGALAEKVRQALRQIAQ